MKSVNLKGLAEQFHKDNEINLDSTKGCFFKDIILDNVLEIRSLGTNGLQIIYKNGEEWLAVDKYQSSLEELKDFLSKDYKILILYFDDSGESYLGHSNNIEKWHEWEIIILHKIKNLKLTKDQKKELAQIQHDITTNKKYLSKKELLNRLKDIFDESEIESRKSFAINCMYVEGWAIRGRKEFFPYRQGFMEMES